MSKFLSFCVGAIVGSATTYLITKSYFEQISNEEIESVKEAFSNRSKGYIPQDKEEDIDINTNTSSEIDILKQTLESNNYTAYSEKKKEEEKMGPKPYVISPDEVDTIDGYSIIELTYYADGVLTDDMNEIVDDIEETVGKDSLNHFGEYEDDSVFVRNDKLKCDYVILSSELNYSEIARKEWMNND